MNQLLRWTIPGRFSGGRSSSVVAVPVYIAVVQHIILAPNGLHDEGVAEPPLVKAPRIGYFGRIGDFSRFVRIFDSQDVENRLYNKKTAKIGLFRPIFVCFYAISGY